MVAAFRNFQVGVVSRSQFYPVSRHEIYKGVMWLIMRKEVVYLIHDLLVGGGAGYSQDLRVCIGDDILLCSHATGDEYLAILG